MPPENSEISELIKSVTTLTSEVRHQNKNYEEIRQTLFGESGTIGEGLVGKHLVLKNQVDGQDAILNGRKGEPGLVDKVSCIKKQIMRVRIAAWTLISTAIGAGSLLTWWAKTKGLFLKWFEGS